MLIIVIDAMQRLVERDTVQPSDGVHVARVLWIQANVCAGTLGTADASVTSARGEVREEVGEGNNRTGWEVRGRRAG